MTSAERTRLEQLLQEHIPLAGAMQARIRGFDGNTLTVEAPLAANQNHYGTAFGGSIYTVSLLAGWGLASLLLDQAGMVVVEHAEAEYRRPIKQDLVAVAQPAAGTVAAAFAADFRTTGRAHLDVTIEIGPPQQPAFRLNARFAARS